jgi:2-amino-4-hydroxy-6-hydroxymethyldihydropteridine diphosphokinase
MTLAYVGLGANIGDPGQQIEAAIEELKKLPDSRVTAVSGVYRSAPIGHLDQPDFLNAVAELDTDLAPVPLLGMLQQLESSHGRERPFANAPRTLDLDLLLYGDRVLETPRLTLPHPRMHERAFVLAPLTEIAPDIAIPGRGLARALLAACAGQAIERTH